MRYGPAWELQRRYHSCGRWRRQAAPDGDRPDDGAAVIHGPLIMRKGTGRRRGKSSEPDFGRWHL